MFYEKQPIQNRLLIVKKEAAYLTVQVSLRIVVFEGNFQAKYSQSLLKMSICLYIHTYKNTKQIF